MTGQSSVRTACETPNVCQSTTSALLQRAVLRDPLRQPGAAGMLVGVLAGRVQLVRVEAGHPEVRVREAGPAADARLGRRRASSAR